MLKNPYMSTFSVNAMLKQDSGKYKDENIVQQALLTVNVKLPTHRYYPCVNY